MKPLPLSSRIRVIYKKIKNQFLIKNAPNTLVLGVTYRCQLNCVHCGVNGYFDQNKAELTTGEIKKIILQAQRLGVYIVVFFGGEPLLRKDIMELIEFCTKKGIIAAISTNGLLLTSDLVRMLKQKGLSFINLSLDSFDANIHDRLRRTTGCYQKVIDAIRVCVLQKINVFISTYVTPENISRDDVKQIILLSREMGATGVRLLLGIPSGRWLKHQEIIFSEEERKYIFNLLEPTYVYLEGVCNVFTECNAILKKLFYVSPYGEVQPCGFVPLSFGNVRNEPLKHIWGRMVRHSLYKTLESSDCIMRNTEFHNKYINSQSENREFPISMQH